MIRHISALVAVAVLSLSSVACVAENEETTDAAETSQDLASDSAYFETFEGLDGQYYFHVMANNGEKVLRSEGYTSLASADAGIGSILANATDARNYDLAEASSGEFYFTVKAANGEKLGTSQLYSSRSNAQRGARTVRALIRLAREDRRIVRGAGPRPVTD